MVPASKVVITIVLLVLIGRTPLLTPIQISKPVALIETVLHLILKAGNVHILFTTECTLT